MPSNAVKAALGFAGLAGWFGFNVVMAYYTYLWRNRPDHPEAAAGLIARMYHQHTRIFFVHSWERQLAYYGLALSLVLIAAAVLGLFFFRVPFRPKRGLHWLNASSLAVFVAWFGYALWPLS